MTAELRELGSESEHADLYQQLASSHRLLTLHIEPCHGPYRVASDCRPLRQSPLIHYQNVAPRSFQQFRRHALQQEFLRKRLVAPGKHNQVRIELSLFVQ